MGGKGIELEPLLAEGATEVCISDEQTLHMCTRNRNTTHVYTTTLTLSVGLAVGEATGCFEGNWVGIFVGCVQKESKEKLSLDQDVFVNVYTLRELYIRWHYLFRRLISW